MLTKSLNREQVRERRQRRKTISSLSSLRTKKEQKRLKRRREKKKLSFSLSSRLGRAEHLLEDLVLVDDPQDAVRGRLGHAREDVAFFDGALVEHARGLVDGAGELERNLTSYFFFGFEVSRGEGKTKS